MLSLLAVALAALLPRASTQVSECRAPFGVNLGCHGCENNTVTPSERPGLSFLVMGDWGGRAGRLPGHGRVAKVYGPSAIAQPLASSDCNKAAAGPECLVMLRSVAGVE